MNRINKIISNLIILFSVQAVSADAKTVLFIGDSITDGGWGRSGGSMASSKERNHHDLNHIYGHSYMFVCAATLQADFPEDTIVCYNRGISGNTLADLHARWDEDALSLKPDIVSILVGTNDADALLRGKQDFDLEQWAGEYRALLDTTVAALPDVKLLLGTPFVAKVGRIGENDNYARRDSLVRELATVVREVARDYNATIIDYEKMFDSLPEPKSHWIWDGIHPTPAGHLKMSRLWLSKALPADYNPSSSM